MKATRVDVKLFAANPPSGAHVPEDKLLKVFHGIIQQQKVTEEILLDVTSYEHVKEGPGIMLIGHESQYGLDSTKGRLGLLVSQRRAQVTSFEEALGYTLQKALEFAALLEKDELALGGLKFPCDEIMIRINDRLHAPVSPETWKAVEPVARKVLSKLGDVGLEAHSDPRELFTFTVRSKGASSPDAVLAKLKA